MMGALLPVPRTNKNPGTQPGSCNAIAPGSVRVDRRHVRGTIDQFHVGHRRMVASAETALEDAQVAARTGLVTRAEFDEQLADCLLVAKSREREASIGNTVDLA